MNRTPVLVALFAAATFAGSALADCDHEAMHARMHGGGEQMAAMHAKHLAKLHDKLKLTAQQEPAWKAFTDKAKPDLAKRQAAREELSKLATPARLDRMLALMKEGEARMAEHAAAVKEFYAQLTPEQQKLFDDHAMPRLGAAKRAMHGHKDHMEHMNHMEHMDKAAPAATPAK